MQYFTALLLLLLYFALHSALASTAVKTAFERGLGAEAYRFYRLGYNVISIILLAFLLQWVFRPEPSMLPEPFAGQTLLGLLLLGVGAVFNILPMLHYGLGEFMGFDQIFYKKPAGTQDNKLNTSGLNNYVRHPLYFGLILMLTGAFLLHPTMPMLIFFLSVVLYLPFGIYFEEKKLVKQFGEDYKAYQQRVKCLIPFVL